MNGALMAAIPPETINATRFPAKCCPNGRTSRSPSSERGGGVGSQCFIPPKSVRRLAGRIHAFDGAIVHEWPVDLGSEAVEPAIVLVSVGEKDDPHVVAGISRVF